MPDEAAPGTFAQQFQLKTFVSPALLKVLVLYAGWAITVVAQLARCLHTPDPPSQQTCTYPAQNMRCCISPEKQSAQTPLSWNAAILLLLSSAEPAQGWISVWLGCCCYCWRSSPECFLWAASVLACCLAVREVVTRHLKLC